MSTEFLERLATLEAQMRSTIEYRIQMLSTMERIGSRVESMEKKIYTILGLLGAIQMFGDKAVSIVEKAVQ